MCWWGLTGLCGKCILVYVNGEAIHSTEKQNGERENYTDRRDQRDRGTGARDRNAAGNAKPHTATTW